MAMAEAATVLNAVVHGHMARDEMGMKRQQAAGAKHGAAMRLAATLRAYEARRAVRCMGCRAMAEAATVLNAVVHGHMARNVVGMKRQQAADAKHGAAMLLAATVRAYVTRWAVRCLGCRGMVQAAA